MGNSDHLLPMNRDSAFASQAFMEKHWRDKQWIAGKVVLLVMDRQYQLPTGTKPVPFFFFDTRDLSNNHTFSEF